MHMQSGGHCSMHAYLAVLTILIQLVRLLKYVCYPPKFTFLGFLKISAVRKPLSISYYVGTRS